MILFRKDCLYRSDIMPDNHNYSINDIFMKRPASTFCHRWRDGTPIGNGMTGVLLYGGVAREHLIINRSDLWHNGADADIPNVSHCLKEMRELQKQGDYEGAHRVMQNELKRKNYGTTLADMRTLGCVKLDFTADGIYNSYRRIIHADTSEVEITYNLDTFAFCRKYFMSRKRDIAVIKVTSEKDTCIKLSSGFFNNNEGEAEKKTELLDSKFAEYNTANDCHVYSSANNGKYFGIVSKIISNNDISVTKDGIFASPSKEFLILIKVFSCEADRENAINKSIEAINDCPQSYEELYNENLPEYQKYYNTANINIYNGDEFHSNEELLQYARDNVMDNELAEKLWRFGRYLFISGSAENGLPFPLYGIWPCGYDRPFTHNVANENVQSIYWHTDVGGLSNLVLPLINYYFNRMDSFRENAKQLFGCRGIFVGTYTTPINSKIAWWVPVILHFCGVAGWISSHFYKYYKFTKNEKIFQSNILPFMLEAAQFYEDYYYLDNNGKLVLYPAVSPENTPSEFQIPNKSLVMTVTKNPTVEIAILKELLQNLIEISATHSIPQEKVNKWQEMLKAIPDYLINKDGAVAEWIDENVTDYYPHRHISHLYPIFPGNEIINSGNKKLLEHFKRALELRELGAFCGWSIPHISSVFSRLQETEKAFNVLTFLPKVCLYDNFFTTGTDFRDMGITTEECSSEFTSPVQFDAILSYVNAVQEMLLFSTDKILKILPACPKEFGKGNTKLHYQNGTVEINWDIENKLCHGTILAENDTNISLELPFEEKIINLKLSQGETFKF